MSPVLGFIIVSAVAFLGAVLVFPRLDPRNPIVSGLAVSGIPYLLLGMLMGPRIFNLLSEPVLVSLEPLVSLTLGWVGLLFGIHLRWRNLKRFPRNYVLFTLAQALVAFVVILVVSWVLFRFFGVRYGANTLEICLILAALGCTTSPLTIARAMVVNRARGRLTHLIQFVSSMDGLYGIVLAGVVFAFINPSASPWINSGASWLILNIVLGLLIGGVFVFLIRSKFDREELTLLVLGLVIFTSGVGFYLRLSPIFLTMIVGTVIAQFPREAEKANRILGAVEKPIYLILLIFAGALWNFNVGLDILIIAGFVAARFLGKYLGGWIAAKNIYCAFPIPVDVGKILLSFGGISLAIALNFKLFATDVGGNLVIGATIVGITLFDEYAAWSTTQVLRKQGEVQ